MNRSLFILVVDANPDHQLLIGYSLRASTPRTEPVFKATADEALTYLETCAAGQTPFPQLVLLDIHLPQPESGWQLLKGLKMRYPCLPAIVLSTDDEANYVRKAYELGANSFIAKPHNIEFWEGHFQILLVYWLGVVTLSPTL